MLRAGFAFGFDATVSRSLRLRTTLEELPLPSPAAKLVTELPGAQRKVLYTVGRSDGRRLINILLQMQMQMEIVGC